MFIFNLVTYELFEFNETLLESESRFNTTVLVTVVTTCDSDLQIFALNIYSHLWKTRLIFVEMQKECKAPRSVFERFS